jgi:predicted small lipoprotein YifL
MNRNLSSLVVFAVFAVSLAACAQTGGAAKPDGSSAPPASAKVPPGMSSDGEVIDPSKVESGHGQNVKGLNDFEGEITGVPVAGGRFSQLQIGMGIRQVMDICGPPSDQGAYITGKAFIPFYFGSDRSRYELFYKGQGRLIFAGGAVGNYGGGNLVWIINSANESGYR